MTDVRNDIVHWAKWSVENRSRFVYTEGPERMSAVHDPNANPIFCDCSAFVTYCYSWAGAPDPNGQGYDGQGYTGTLLSHGTHLDNAAVAIPGDVVVYGPGTGDHTALIVEAGPDPLTVSMGQQGDPSYVRVSQDGRQPQTFLRFSTDSSQPIPPAPPAPSQDFKENMKTLSTSNPGPNVVDGQVKTLQACLRDKAAQNIAVDGRYGQGTADAVKNIQKFFGLAVDGVCGPATWPWILY